MRLLPPTKSVSSTSETTSSCPTISLRSSVRMRSRPPFMRSASARSSGDSSAIVSVAKRSTRNLFSQRSRGPGLRIATATLAVALAKAATPARCGSTRFARSPRPQALLIERSGTLKDFSARPPGHRARVSAFCLLPSAFYLPPSTCLAYLAALHREVCQQLFQLPGIPVRVHAVLQQLQRFNPLFERLALGVERAQLRIRGGRRGRGRLAERQDRGDAAVPRLRARVGAAFAVAVVVEQRVL